MTDQRLYRKLVQALRDRGHEDLAGQRDVQMSDVDSEPEGEMVEQLIVRHLSNTAWMIQRCRWVDMDFTLYWGIVDPDGDVRISVIDLDYGIVEELARAVDRDKHERDTCRCGHRVTSGGFRHIETGSEVSGVWCPGCGWSGHDPVGWVRVWP